jgi:hypothetical protein
MIRIACTLQFHASLFPLFYYRRALRERGIVIRFLKSCDLTNPQNYSRFDYVFLSDRLYRRQFSLEQLQRLSTLRNKTYWFDETASTGTTHFEVLPYVDRYLKRQLLRDTTQYAHLWYRRRIFSDYYHRQFGITDADPHYTETALNTEYAHKLGLYWNLAYKDYRKLLRPLRAVTRHVSPLAFLSPRFLAPSQGRREIDVFARISTKPFAATVGYQRQEILRLLDVVAADGVRVAYRGTVPKSQYERELAVSRTVVSPFGYGEICYRDFEAMVNGACLIKPDVSHLTTWPDVFVANKTYIPFSWDLSTFPTTVRQALQGDSAEHVASRAQNLLKEYIGQAGTIPFRDRFQDLLGV